MPFVPVVTGIWVCTGGPDLWICGLAWFVQIAQTCRAGSRPELVAERHVVEERDIHLMLRAGGNEHLDRLSNVCHTFVAEMLDRFWVRKSAHSKKSLAEMNMRVK